MILRFTERHRVRFIVGILPPADVDFLSHADLKRLVLKLLEELAALKRTVAGNATKSLASTSAARAHSAKARIADEISYGLNH